MDKSNPRERVELMSEWSDPITKTRPSSDKETPWIQALVDRLRERPGNWMIVAKYDHKDGASRARATLQKRSSMKAHGIEFTSRLRKEDGETHSLLYARVREEAV